MYEAYRSVFIELPVRMSNYCTVYYSHDEKNTIKSSALFVSAPWMPIMCSRIRTLSARIFRASLSCCTASPCTVPSCWLKVSVYIRSVKRKRKKKYNDASYLIRASSWLSFWPWWSLRAKECCYICAVFVTFMQDNILVLTGRPCSPVAPGGPW